MQFYADFHIHSRFSRACSKRLTLPEIYRWCQLKGITVIGASDFTHPQWQEEIKEQLQEDESGFFELKEEYARKVDKEIPPTCRRKVKFILSTEISLIYKKRDRVRKVHNVILAPNIQTDEKLTSKLSTIGNLKADGRPILGLDSRDLLEIMLEVNDKCMLIPSHIWTPWFSVFGDKSGFDSLEECFEDLTHHIYAIETGLSSDPSMNWMVKDLDKVTIISNSDAHSPEKMAREANVFNCSPSYKNIIGAIKKNDARFEGTIEFYPQEGKYHYDGHRACNITWSPEESEKHNLICPKCNRRLTVGVLNRVYKLAKRKKGEKPKGAKPYYYIIPLVEVLSEILDKGVNTKTVKMEHFKLLNKFGSELKIALGVPIPKLAQHSDLLAKAISKIRNNKVTIKPGYDGVYGEVSIFKNGERNTLEKEEQISLL